ncbi:ATP-binding protein [Collinsella sp. LCP19S3_D2]|uniref:ATP-binding protein n=1 Tax=unclassified Collinsella TaxID=2637548 RepID=UPI003F921084
MTASCFLRPGKRPLTPTFGTRSVDGARLLFQVVSQAYETQSVVFTTNLEFSRWGSVFGDDQMAAAVIDRVVHHGRLLQFRGESYRVRHALMSPDGGGAE